MAEQNQFFYLTLRVSNIFFSLHSLGVIKTLSLWKKVFHKNGGLNGFLIPAAIFVFFQNFFLQNMRHQHQINAKRRLKNVGYSQNYVKKSDFDPPFWIEPSFSTHLTKYSLDSCC
jgi:hypothetical protein